MPKQYALIGENCVLAHTVKVFMTHPEVRHVQVVIHRNDRELYQNTVASRCDDGSNKLLEPVFGGDRRQASVLAGLEALSSYNPDSVLIHDGARPFVDHETIDALLSKISKFDGAICAIPVCDTLKREGGKGTIQETLSRTGLWRAQTPQGFRLTSILEAHRKAFMADKILFSDDASVAEWAGLKVVLVTGRESNIKLTTPEDLVLAQQRAVDMPVGEEKPKIDVRVGTGYDVHRFAPGDHLWLCGVRVPFNKTLVGHSDADVGLHALTDALLGAIGEGDIGTHFPPSDPRWKGARSDHFLKHAVALVRERRGDVGNVDITLICESPKIGPFRTSMRQAIGNVLGLDVERISIKATTSEGLGFTGREEGIAAMASICLVLPA